MTVGFLLIVFGALWLVGAAIVLLVLCLSEPRGRRIAAAGGLGLLGVILTLGAYFWMGMQRSKVVVERNASHHVEQSASDRAHQIATARPRVEPSPTPPPIAGMEAESGAPFGRPAWLDADEYFPIADVYPSVEAAARGLAAKVARGLTEEGTLDPEAIRKRVQSKALAVVAKAKRDRIKQLKRSAPIGPDGLKQQGGNSDVYRLIVGVEVGPRGDDRLNAAVERLGETVVYASVTTLHKPWVEDFSAYMNRNPNRKVFRARSRTPATSATEARRKAMDDAVRQLQERVLTQLAPRHDRISEQRLWSVIRAEFMAGRPPIADRFVQRFERPSSADVYRAELLVDNSSSQIDHLVSSFERQQRAVRASWARLIFSLAGLALLIWVLYLFLNAATRGYYVITLRSGAFLLLVIGLLVVFAIIR